MAGELNAVVESPKGVRNKYEYDPELGGIKIDADFARRSWV
jgi:inorganic pyrophosphatase